jgi:hypothetical protein
VDTQDVGEKRWLGIGLKHAREYHRYPETYGFIRLVGWDTIDDSRVLTYSVNPPLD